MIKKAVRVDPKQIEFFEAGNHPHGKDFSKFTRTAINHYIRHLTSKQTQYHTHMENMENIHISQLIEELRKEMEINGDLRVQIRVEENNINKVFIFTGIQLLLSHDDKGAKLNITPTNKLKIF